jgi:microcystin-dependent protein
MAEPFLSEIRIVSFDFAPRGWAFCAGQLLPISQNTALFSLLGTTYGGDGKSNFGLPNLQGCGGMGWGQGAGLTDRVLGETGGEAGVTLLANQLPSHLHSLLDNNGNPQIPGAEVGNLQTPATGGSVPAGTTLGAAAWNGGFSSADSGLVDMAASNTTAAGSGIPHNNLMPYLTLNYCIAMQGVFPSRG